MGVYLNPGNESFFSSSHSKIYVDKTEMMAYINSVLGTEQRYLCMSRPRRFGKSIAANMLAAYYGKGCDSHEVFKPLKIANKEDFEKYLNQYDVIFLDIQLLLARAESISKLISYIQTVVLQELRETYGEYFSPQESSLSSAIATIYAKKPPTHKGFIFILDEWDCIFREAQDNKEVQKEYLDFLKGIFKGQICVKLVYMTGILPVKKYGTHSALNIFTEYSMLAPEQLAEYVGFTQQEVMALCEQYHMDFQELKNWYDGYYFQDKLHIYNPKSVVEAMLHQVIRNYWSQTETYEALKVYIDLNFDHLKDSIVKLIGGERLTVDVTAFQNDMTTFSGQDDVLTLLIHLGYLAYDSEREEVFIPNEELREEFIRTTKRSGWNEVIKALEHSDHLLEATLQMNEAAVAKAIDEVHMDNTSIIQYNNENALSLVISMAYYSARKEYMLFREFPTGKGIADIVFLPKGYSDKPAIVVELKWNVSAEGAIRQIKERRYGEALGTYEGEVLLVGINYDKRSKLHTCKIAKLTI